MNKEISNVLFSVLTECRNDGFVVLTKDSPVELREAINEAKARNWICSKNPYSYELTPTGIDILDFSSLDEYLEHQRIIHESKKVIQQPVINAVNVLYGENHGTINQSSSHDKITKINSVKRHRNKLFKILKTIIIGIIIWLITQYILMPFFSGN
ncbi:hypothetical protein [Mangrovibacterium lignilyticum]|uniref:hypothetical protein n=1 Tax=Mangrovibacterium lignilyticum TaxID=2668052 RepID=UPI0013D64F14|nr:hypothetical protein [Mangrovibacterium lignilyticum]